MTWEAVFEDRSTSENHHLYTKLSQGFGRLFSVLTAKTQYNLTNVREYFEEHPCVGDYDDEGQRVSGQWIGVAAEQLGLSGKIRADDFLRLCENQRPKTGETLTQRLNTVRLNDGKPELAGANLKEIRVTLAVKTRARKQKDLSRVELRTLWDARRFIYAPILFSIVPRSKFALAPRTGANPSGLRTRRFLCWLFQSAGIETD
jgi:hypothetical protein